MPTTLHSDIMLVAKKNFEIGTFILQSEPYKEIRNRLIRLLDSKSFKNALKKSFVQLMPKMCQAGANDNKIFLDRNRAQIQRIKKFKI
jgi:hypothetical protein